MRGTGITMHVAFFNWFGTKRSVGFEVAEGDVTEFWTGSPVAKRDGMITASLPPHSSVMFTVRHISFRGM